MPLDVKFSPDTPLCCQPDGTLARSAEQCCLNLNCKDHDLPAVLLLLKGARGRVFVRVCVQPRTRGIATLHISPSWNWHDPLAGVFSHRIQGQTEMS